MMEETPMPGINPLSRKGRKYYAAQIVWTDLTAMIAPAVGAGSGVLAP
jgi:hypothetical protein